MRKGRKRGERERRRSEERSFGTRITRDAGKEKKGIDEVSASISIHFFEKSL